ncbi:hypothetical protein [Pedobacter sp.]|uniref:hypothetical protein n=1 Tax=Pedobacter sp. TaxID=1411316 RepID=UPI00396C4442
MEKNCKWHFKPEGGRDVGPNDPVDEKFKGQPYYSIVREAIQNSLDAIYDQSKPVKVDFTFFNLNRNDYPELFDIEAHINQCRKYYPDDVNAERLFKNMLYYLNGDIEGKKRLSLACLKISDYNTIGMNYTEKDTKSPFYAFLKAGGVSAKSQGSGGSFGFGKGAYYTLSPIKTIIVSTKTDIGNVFFEGSTILTTHTNDQGTKLTAYGYYDNNDGEPTQKEIDIPEIFRRVETGTDVNIIGLWDEPKRITLMIKSVLNNFWMAIHDSKLVVQVDDIIIDKENLEQKIDEYFPSDGFESGNASEIESWNPKSYLKAVKYTKTSDQYHLFENTLETVGNVKLYVYLEKGLPNRISFFRKPRMVVFKRTNRKVNGYSAVFICENEKGNEILRLMENPAHSEWKKENYPKDEGKISRIARKAENEISDFVNKSLESLSKIKAGKKITFLGLEEYLSIPEDLLEKEEEFDYIGNVSSSSSGVLSTEMSDDETGIQTTDNTPIKIKPTLIFKPQGKENTEIDNTDEGEEDVIVGGENNGDDGGGDDLPPGDGSDTVKGKRRQDSNDNKVLIKVGLRVIAQKENNTQYHILMISSDKQIHNAELELLVGADNDRDDGVAIVFSDNGLIENNVIKNFSLVNGINKIKIQFIDNLKHSIKVKAYEVQ